MPRRCEVSTPHGWCAFPFGKLEPGMIFRLFEEDGAPVADEDGVTRWRALGPPGEKNGKPTIDAEQVPESEVERQMRTRGMFWPSGPRGGWSPGPPRGGWAR